MDVPSFRTLEEHLFLAGSWSKLAGVYECRIAALEPNDPEWADLMLRLGRLSAERLGDPSAARRRYEELLQSHPENYEVLASLRRLCMEMGDLGAALQIAATEEQLELGPSQRAATLAEVGDLYRRLGIPAEAKRRFNDALGLDPGCDAAIAGAAALAEDAQQTDDAIRLHERRLDALTGAARTEVMRHLVDLLPGSEQDRIRSLLREIVRASPKQRSAHEQLLEIEKSLGAWERVDELQRALWKLSDANERQHLAQEAATLQLEEAGNIEAALHWAARADEVAADDPAVLRLRTQILRRAGHTSALIGTLERLVAGGRPTAQESLELAVLYDRGAQPDLATQRLQSHLAQHPEDPEALELFDRLLARSGHHAPRVEILERRIALCADTEECAQLQSELGDILAGPLENRAGAERVYRDALARVPGHGPSALRLEQLLSDAGRVEELAHLLEEQAKQGRSAREKAEAWCKLGALRLQPPADPVGARIAYVWALECDAELRSALEGLRQVAAVSGDATALLEACERELSLDPDPARAVVLLCEVVEASRQAGDLPRARRAAARCAELEPEAPALRALAEVGRDLGDPSCERDALEALEASLTPQPEERARVLVRLGDLVLEQADPESLSIAARWYRESLGFDPVPEVRERLIDLYRRSGDLSELAFELRALVNSCPLETTALQLKELAQTLAELGDYAHASETLESAFKLDPDNREIGDLFESVLAQQERTQELCEVLGLRLARERDPQCRRELACRWASLLIDRLARPGDALAVLHEFADPIRDEDLERLYARALELAGSLGEHEAWLALRESHVDGEERLSLLLRLASLQEQDGRTELALMTLKRAEQLAAPDQRELVRRPLLALLRELGDPETQLHFLSKLVEDAEDPAARAAFRGERARIQAQNLEQGEQALVELEAARAEAPLGIDELRLMTSLSRRFGGPVRQVSALEALAEASPNPDEVGQALRELAQLRLEGSDEVRDSVEAEGVLRRLIALEPEDDGTFERYLRFLEGAGRKQDLAALLEESLNSSLQSPERRGALAIQLARVQSELGQSGEAAQTLLRAREAGASGPALDEVLFTSLDAAGDAAACVELCEQQARRESGLARERWLRRGLAALAQTDEPAEKQLDVIARLLEQRPGDAELLALSLPLLRGMDRFEALSTALKKLLQGDRLSDGQRRVYSRELLRLYEGPLQNPGAALALLEDQLRNDPALRPRVARLAARVGDPRRLVEILSPLVLEASQDEPPEPEWLRQLGLALLQLGQEEQAEPLLWRALEANPLNRELIQALEQRLKNRNDLPGLLRFFESHFPLESAPQRAVLAREACSLAEQVAGPEATLRWLRRWQALEPLPAKAARLWLTLEREVGDGPGVLLALRTLGAQSRDPNEQAALLADEAALHAQRGELDLAREQYAKAIRMSARPSAGWLEALDHVLASAGRNAERVDVLRALLQRSDLRPDTRATYQKEYIALLSTQPELRAEASLELRQLIDTDRAARPAVQIKRMRALLALHEELGQPTEWCTQAERLLPLLSGLEHSSLERELAQRLTRSLRARERAIARWEAILSHSPEDSEALGALAELLCVAGQEAKRAAVLERLADSNPSQRVPALLEAARLRWELLRDARGALPDLERVLAEAPDLRRAHELRSEVCAYLGRAAEETASLRVLLPDEPAGPQAARAWLRLGQILIGSPDTAQEAIEAVDRALELAPQDTSLSQEARAVFESGRVWIKATGVLIRQLEVAQPAEQPALLRELARIEWDELRDAPQACTRLTQLEQIDRLDADDHLRWADALAHEERWPESLTQRSLALEALGEMAPTRAWLDLAENLLARTDAAAEACAACDAAIERDPELIEAILLRARLHARLGNVPEEIEDRVRLGKLLPAGADAAEALAQAAALAREKLQDEARAHELYQAALKRDSARISALLGAGGIALERGEWNEAEQLLGRACSLLREEPRAESLANTAELAARAALKLERDTEAFRYLELALAHEPHHGEALDAMAELSLQRGARAQARRCLETRLEDTALLPEQRAERLARLARACEELGELEPAAAALAELASLRPEDAGARTRTLDLLERLGEAERAIAQIGAWIECVPSNQRSALALRAARFQRSAGKITEARGQLETLLAADASSAEAWLELAQLGLEMEGPEAALGVTKRALAAIDPPAERGPLLWLEARALDTLQRPAEAGSRAYESLVADPSNVDAARMLASNLGVAGNWQRAASQLEHTLVATNPSAPVKAELWEAIGRAYAGPLEDIEHAERCYRRALECNAWRSSAREALADVTAFDPGSHPESIHQHRDLLEEFPARTGSWRALARIANHWKRRSTKQACEAVLKTLAAKHDEPRSMKLPARLIASGASRHRVISSATEVLRALEEQTLPPPTTPDVPQPLEGEIWPSLRSLVGHWWELSDEALRSVWRNAASGDESGASEMPRRARRRMRRALRGLEPHELSALEPEFWREQVLAQAAAMALSQGKCSLGDALLHLLALWPATSHLGVRSGGDLGAAVQLCPPARALLLRIRDAVIRSLGVEVTPG